MKLFTYEYRNVMGISRAIAAPKVYKTPAGANSGGIAFRKAIGDPKIDIRVVELVKKGTGRVVADYAADIGKWH